MDEKTVQAFAQNWFDELSDHVPVERLLTYLSGSRLQMVFPERTLHSYSDFADWYAQVGRTFSDQNHTIERLQASVGSQWVDVAVTVVWAATEVASGTRSVFRVNQTWRLLRGSGDTLRIENYRVGELVPIADAPAAVPGSGTES